MTFKFGYPANKNSYIPPTNTGLQIYAQARLDNVVPRAVQKHANSLTVDGIYLYAWLKNRTAPICTCSGHKFDSSSTTNLLKSSGDVNTDLRQPRTNLPSNEGNSPEHFNPFRFSVGEAEFNDGNQFDGPPPLPSNLDGGNTSDDNSLLESLSQPVDPETLARFVAGIDSGAVFGGDKTKCGICYSSGYVNGYSLYNGQRFVLDASGNWPFELINGAELDSASKPYKFKLSGPAYVQWYVDLPPFVAQWLNFNTANNLDFAPGVVLEIYYNGVWNEVTLSFLISLSGSNSLSAIPVRVRVDSSMGLEEVEFTHAELTCMFGPPLLGQSPLVSFNLNWEQQQALVSTNFEILGNIEYIPRETVFQDSRLNIMWKCLDITRKVTANGQVFGYDVNVRRILDYEVQHKMTLPILNPNNYQNQIVTQV